jgi:D-3-phosphoglycerate dehydrogenase
MPEWNILVADGIIESGLSLLRAAARVDDCPGISTEDLLATIEQYDALIVRSRTLVNAVTFHAARKLKVVGRAGVGVDNIDLAAANQHNVTVVNTPFATTQAVVEHALGMMLALARRIPEADGSMKSGLWKKKDLVGLEISGKVLGIIGMGNIGSRVARLGIGLGMVALGHDPLVAGEAIRQQGVEPVSLPDLLSRSDFVSLHVPLIPETREIINGQTMGLMKRGAYLICTARGNLIDETALLGALEAGRLAGAALDVFAEEPPGLSALVSHPRVIATPHIASQTHEAQDRASHDVAEEVLAALRGKPLRWKVV